jgi:hypothetical protein
LAGTLALEVLAVVLERPCQHGLIRILGVETAIWAGTFAMKLDAIVNAFLIIVQIVLSALL